MTSHSQPSGFQPLPGTSGSSPHTGILWVVAAGIALYLAGDLARLGLNLDGLVYANIASLLANGVGSFWSLPDYTGSDGVFREHPPLGIWLQSLWFAAFGDVFWVEKLMAAALTLGCFGLTLAIYRALSGRPDGWLPLLILALMPVSTYTLKNNFLESIVAVATLASVWVVVARPPTFASAGAAAAGILTGLFSKGPVALFPLAAPLVLGAWRRPGLRRALMQTLLIGALVALVVLSVLAYPPAREALADYLTRQVYASVTGARAIVNDRLALLYWLTVNLTTGLVPVVLCCLIGRRQPALRAAGPALLLALLASLPLLISSRHFHHYLLPAMPLFAIGFALLCPLLRPPRLPYRSLAALIALLAVVRTIALWGEVGEDHEEIMAAAEVAPIAGAGLVGFCPEAGKQDLFPGYLYRYGGVRSDRSPAPDEQLPVFVCPVSPGAGYEPVRRLEALGNLQVWRLRADAAGPAQPEPIR